MLNWFRRNDGFKWKEYVRTTVLVRRARRKAHVENAVALAADGARAAGAAAAAGAGKAASKAGDLARAGGQSLAGLAGKAGEAVRPMAHKSADAVRPVADVLARPSVSRPLAIVAALAMLAALVRLITAGLDRQAAGALAVGLIAATLSFGPRWLNGNGPSLPRLPEGVARLALSRRGLAIGGAAVMVIAVAAAAFGRGPSLSGILASLPSVPALAARTVEGRASVVSGDLIRLDGVVYRLAGIEAPEREQRCGREGGRPWPCGKSAEQALVKLVRGRTIACDLRGRDDAGRPTATCRDGSADINAQMVKGGHAFAARGMLATYAGAEQEARSQKAGIWRGEAERPSDFRAKIWDEAKRRAPDGCPIKGQVTPQGKQYVVPGASDYARRTVQRQRGDRWFCSEQDAIAAGFKAVDRG